MASEQQKRTLSLRRTGPGAYTATNDRGGEITFGMGEGQEFTPVDLLLTSIAGCTAIDVDLLTTRLAEPERFEVEVDADKVRDEAGNHLTDIAVTFRIRFPEGEAGDAARKRLPDAVAKSRDRLCTVSRTIELGTPISYRVEE
jgi:putative redox protein